jgi:hypothetical protein
MEHMIPRDAEQDGDYILMDLTSKHFVRLVHKMFLLQGRKCMDLTSQLEAKDTMYLAKLKGIGLAQNGPYPNLWQPVEDVFIAVNAKWSDVGSIWRTTIYNRCKPQRKTHLRLVWLNIAHCSEE